MTQPMKLSIVVALTRDGGLGAGGRLLYRISDDMRHFKALTMGKPIIMGRKTFESFPSGPLPGRLNIVVTRNDGYAAPEGVAVVGSVDGAIAVAQASGATEAMVIGGGEIYRAMLPMASELYVTEIDATSPAGTDVWFAEALDARRTLVDASAPAVDPRSGVAYRFARYRLD